MSKFTKFKDGQHYCPECNTLTKNCMRIENIDVKMRDIGKQFGHPEYGAVIKCIKCGWSGLFYIESDIFKKLEQKYRQYEQSKKQHFKRNVFVGR